MTPKNTMTALTITTQKVVPRWECHDVGVGYSGGGDRSDGGDATGAAAKKAADAMI